MKHWIRCGFAVLVMGIVVSAAAGCGSSGSSGTAAGGTPVSGGSLKLALGGDPGNLDPQRSVDGQNLLLSVFAYDTPVKMLNSGKIAPEVVSKWEARKKSYVLTIEKGVTCADGSPMDAKTVAANINYVADPDNGSPMTGVAVPEGAKATADAAAGTVTVKLAEEAPFFMENIAELPLICSKGLADRGSLAKASDGSGPYVLSGVKPGVSYEFTLRKGYKWGPGGATTDAEGIPEKLTFNVVTSTTTIANQLLSGQLNVAQVSGSDTKRLDAAGLFSAGSNLIDNELAFHEVPGESVADPAVRKALISALDLEALAQIDTGGLGKEADGLIASPKICAGNTMEGNVPEYDPEAAKAALEGKDVSVLLVFSNSSPTNSSTAQYIADQWQKAGVHVTLKQQSFDQTSAIVFGTADWGATLIGLGVNNPATLAPFFSGPAPTEGNNFGHFENEEYERLTASASSKPGQQGCADWNAAEGALFKEADITPISTLPFLYWGKDAEFEANLGVLFPTSLRVLNG